MTMEATLASEVEASVLRLAIAGRWELSNFSMLFDSIDKLHRSVAFVDDLKKDFKIQHLVADEYSYLKDIILHRILYEQPFTAQAPISLPPSTLNTLPIRLDESTPPYEVVVPSVISIQYSSPGKIEILGLGKVIGEIRKFLEHRDFLRVNQALKAEELAQEHIATQMRRIKLFKDTIKTMRDIGFSDEKIREMLAVEFSAGATIVNLLDQRKIERIEQKDVEPG
jgi:hypothetical protein